MNRLALIAFLAAAASEGAVSDTKKWKNGTSFSSLFLVPSNHSRNKTSSAVRRHKSHDLASAIAHDNARRSTGADEAWATFIPDSNSTEGGQDDTKYLRCYFPRTIFAPSAPSVGFEAALQQPKLEKKELLRSKPYREFLRDREAWTKEGLIGGNLLIATCTCTVIFIKCVAKKEDKKTDGVEDDLSRSRRSDVQAALILGAVLFAVGCFIRIARALYIANEERIEKLFFPHDHFAYVHNIYVHLMKLGAIWLGIIFGRIGILVLTMIAPDYFDLDKAFLQSPAVLLFVGYWSRDIIIHLYDKLSHVRSIFCEGHDDLAFYLDSPLWRLQFYVIAAMYVWLCVQLAFQLIREVKTGAGDRLPLPPRLYPSTALFLIYVARGFEIIFNQSFVLRDTCSRIVDVNYCQTTNAAFRSVGKVNMIVMIGAAARWLMRSFSDENVAVNRTRNLFQFVQIWIFGMFLPKRSS
jgi:hypothetical protein